MAWSFNETDQYATIGDDAALSLPDGDWTIGGWLKLDDNDGTSYQYFFSWNTIGTNNSIGIYFREGGAYGQLTFRVKDGDGTEKTLISDGTPGSLTRWQHVLARRIDADNKVEMYLDGVYETYNWATDLGAVNHTGSLYLGARSDVSATRMYGGDMAEWAKWDRALSTDEIAALAAGYPVSDFYDSAIKWHLPMNDWTERIAGLTVTPVGSPPLVLDSPVMNQRRRPFAQPFAVGA